LLHTYGDPTLAPANRRLHPLPCGRRGLARAESGTTGSRLHTYLVLAHACRHQADPAAAI